MKILLGMSGGVDSAFSAKALINSGHCVEGATLVMHDHTQTDMAALACKELGIKLNVIDAKKSFLNIINNFIFEYSEGRTPNPCIICNERVKFRFLYEYAVENGFDAIATGHYARIVKIDCDEGERFAVAMSDDVKKDQSYMLYRLPQEILRFLILPLSHLKKAEVRQLSADAGISASKSKDSQEICFLPDGSHAEFVESVIGKSPEGDFVDAEGRVLGRHKGIIRYTVGQRKGLGISLGERVFVSRIDAKDNTVTLSRTNDGRSEFFVKDVVFSGMSKVKEDTTVTLDVKIRYSAATIQAEVTFFKDGKAFVRLKTSATPAPGQSAVFYKDGVVMAGGFIE